MHSLVGLFYMLLLAVGIALLIAAAERILAACPCIGHRFDRIWHSGAGMRLAQVYRGGCKPMTDRRGGAHSGRVPLHRPPRQPDVEIRCGSVTMPL